MRNVYLAGKIQKSCWRHSIVDDLRDSVDASCGDNGSLPANWPILLDAINPNLWDSNKAYDIEIPTFNYIGPFFAACNHGCFHGPDTHGYDSAFNFQEEEVEGEREEYHGSLIPDIKDLTMQLCLNAIRNSDLVFAWVDSPDAYGTIAEIGYAYAQGKEVYIAGPEYYKDLWFAYRMSRGGWWGPYDEPKAPLKRALQVYTFDKLYDKHLNLCESPIEKKFYQEAIFTLSALVPQYEIGLYRTDFALIHKKIAIEIDGHDYHKTKEQRTKDAKRERYLETSGWRVIRFTGSEVYKDADNCIAEAKALIEKWSDR